ncbi:hypothetical protein Poli38472_009800 [Pythium oligandrum]|uniref:Uncharacterized protein n=1 Tax=Pythium oligandrum TaxID=41045 RepID=A0A8K1CHN1_PYTOL|nr:hypothetical protein Poli38472_009800 [Pythium oligandrum]|eukprot:TMW62307.1 hypothetical protein Poli38472_009800 [Pythium oligandrum]
MKGVTEPQTSGHSTPDDVRFSLDALNSASQSQYAGITTPTEGIQPLGATERGITNEDEHRSSLDCSDYELREGETVSATGIDEVNPTNYTTSQVDEPNKVPQSVTFRDLYRYASHCDRAWLAIGCLMSVINGMMNPLMAILFGKAISSFRPLDMTAVEQVALAYFGIAVALFVSDYAAHVCLQLTAERQMHKLRVHFFRHVLYKQAAWYDTNPTDVKHTSQLYATTFKINEGLGAKLGEALRCVAQFVTGYSIGFATHWGVSIVMASVMPLMAMCLSWIIKTLRQRTAFSQQKYAEAGAIAEETLRSMRTVAAFTGESQAVAKYLAKAKGAEAENIKMVRVLSIVLGIFVGTIWITYAAGLWFGARLVADRKTDPGTVFTAFYGILIGTISLARISPNFASVASAKACAASLFKILDEASAVDASKEEDGLIPHTCQGKIQVTGVDFAYPTRPDMPVLKNYSVTISAGETVAFVGPSGGGKSTLLKLLQRFYIPQAGKITLDGHDIATLQLRWLRAQIGVVGQEPVLFATTIFENIAAALDGHAHLKDEERRACVEVAARLSNAHAFISSLPDGYDTMVGEQGVMLSGGQKQRVAIARALVRDPQILILDEATSALDTESEAIIQAALDTILQTRNRTTLIIAHRLSTIRRAHRICVVMDGAIVESGAHEELMSRENGKFQQLVQTAQVETGMVPRNASLEWHSSWQDVLDSDRSSSMPILTTRSMDVTLPDSKRSELVHMLQNSDMDDCTQEKSSLETVKTPSTNATKASTGGIYSTMRRLMYYNRPERCYMVSGMIAAILNGLSFPCSAILLSAIVSTMVNKYAAYQFSMKHMYLHDLYVEVWWYAVAFIGGSIGLIAINYIQSFSFKYMAERLVTRLRDLHFRAICRQEMAFFDDSRHGSGALASELATLSTQAANLAGDSPGRVVQAASTFIAALVISFWLGSWLLSIIMCVILPMLIIANVVRTNHDKGVMQKDKTGSDATARANALASEAVANIQTVAAFGMEQKMIDEYRRLSLLPLPALAKRAHRTGLMLGFSSFVTFAVYALVFWYGGVLVGRGQITFGELIRSLMAILISANGVGQATSHLTNVDTATRAATQIFELEDRPTAIDPFCESGVLPSSPAKGFIEFEDIHFAYPARAQVPVLSGVSLRIEPGQVVALCGPSGGGKSTLMALLERFYDPASGVILLDGMPIHTLNIRWLRSQFGLISQEPVLFAGSIYDNILYGSSAFAGDDRDPDTIERVQFAATLANAHEFIAAFPDGYDTIVGGGRSGECQLSGGQKQRIAIARAILRDPPILLLDEATSALDAESEQLVQDALEVMIKMKKHTTLVIAHRMRTIRNADKICVIANGNIAEMGTHSELMRCSGVYAKLVDSASDERLSMSGRLRVQVM